METAKIYFIERWQVSLKGVRMSSNYIKKIKDPIPETYKVVYCSLDESEVDDMFSMLIENDYYHFKKSSIEVNCKLISNK